MWKIIFLSILIISAIHSQKHIEDIVCKVRPIESEGGKFTYVPNVESLEGDIIFGSQMYRQAINGNFVSTTIVQDSLTSVKMITAFSHGSVTTQIYDTGVNTTQIKVFDYDQSALIVQQIDTVGNASAFALYYFNYTLNQTTDEYETELARNVLLQPETIIGKITEGKFGNIYPQNPDGGYAEIFWKTTGDWSWTQYLLNQTDENGDIPHQRWADTGVSEDILAANSHLFATPKYVYRINYTGQAQQNTSLTPPYEVSEGYELFQRQTLATVSKTFNLTTDTYTWTINFLQYTGFDPLSFASTSYQMSGLDQYVQVKVFDANPSDFIALHVVPDDCTDNDTYNQANNSLWIQRQNDESYQQVIIDNQLFGGNDQQFQLFCDDLYNQTNQITFALDKLFILKEDKINIYKYLRSQNSTQRRLAKYTHIDLSQDYTDNLVETHSLLITSSFECDCKVRKITGITCFHENFKCTIVHQYRSYVGVDGVKEPYL